MQAIKLTIIPVDELPPSILDRIREAPIRTLGSGVKGIAYLLPSGRVLKITSDDSELRAMETMRRAGANGNLVKVYDVFVAKVGRKFTGVVLREAADHTIDEIPELHNAAAVIRLANEEASDVYGSEIELGGDEAEDVAMREATSALIGVLEDTELHYEGKTRLYLSDDEGEVLRQLADAVQALKNIGILGFDFDPRNVGVNDGRVLVFDVGMVTTPDVEIPVIGGTPKRRTRHGF